MGERERLEDMARRLERAQSCLQDGDLKGYRHELANLMVIGSALLEHFDQPPEEKKP